MNEGESREAFTLYSFGSAYQWDLLGDLDLRHLAQTTVELDCARRHPARQDGLEFREPLDAQGMHLVVALEQRIDVGEGVLVAEFLVMLGVFFGRLDLLVDDEVLFLLERPEQRPELRGLIGSQRQSLGHDVSALCHEVAAELRDDLFVGDRRRLCGGSRISRPCKRRKSQSDCKQKPGLHSKPPLLGRLALWGG